MPHAKPRQEHRLEGGGLASRRHKPPRCGTTARVEWARWRPRRAPKWHVFTRTNRHLVASRPHWALPSWTMLRYLPAQVWACLPCLQRLHHRPGADGGRAHGRGVPPSHWSCFPPPSQSRWLRRTREQPSRGTERGRAARVGAAPRDAVRMAAAPMRTARATRTPSGLAGPTSPFPVTHGGARASTPLGSAGSEGPLPRGSQEGSR